MTSQIQEKVIILLQTRRVMEPTIYWKAFALIQISHNINTSLGFNVVAEWCTTNDILHTLKYVVPIGF